MKPKPEELVDEIIRNGRLGSTVCGKLSYVKEALRLLRERVPEEYRFELDAAEQYRNDFATYDAILQFLFNVRRDALIDLNVSLVFVFPPDFKNGREIKQSDKLAYKIQNRSTLKLTAYMRLSPEISLLGKNLDHFSDLFYRTYMDSEQQREDRARAKQPPGSFLYPGQVRKKRNGQLHPDAYAV